MSAFKGVSYKSKDFGEMFNGMYFLVIFLAIFNYVLMHVVLAAYFKLYEAKGKVSPTIEEVWGVTMQYIVPQFFISIIYTVITFISVFFCVVPFFYFAVVFAPFTMIYIIEGGSFGAGFNRCFALIKDNYWMSFAIYSVAYIIYLFGSMIIGSVIGVIALAASYFTTKDVAATVGIVTGILSIFTYTFYIIFFVSVALNYFNLTEQLDGDGLMKRIDRMGSNDVSSIEEQY